MRLIPCLILALAFSVSAFSQSPAKAEKIKKYMDVIGSTRLVNATVDNMIDVYKTSYSQVDSTFWIEFRKELKSGELIDLLVPLYDKYLSEEDLDVLIAFYSTPTGQKLIKVLPDIMKESMTIGQKYGEEIGTKVIERLKAKGYSASS
jgi:hypothetical protein